jgi:putative transposon-encoded protein
MFGIIGSQHKYKIKRITAKSQMECQNIKGQNARIECPKKHTYRVLKIKGRNARIECPKKRIRVLKYMLE